MEKKYGIVFYYDQEDVRKCKRVNVLFDDEETAKIIANNVCKEKKLFFKIEEYIC